MLIDIPTAAPSHCLVIEFDNARAQAVLVACVCVCVCVCVYWSAHFANRFYDFLCHTTLSADLEAVTVIKELIASK